MTPYERLIYQADALDGLSALLGSDVNNQLEGAGLETCLSVGVAVAKMRIAAVKLRRDAERLVAGGS